MSSKHSYTATWTLRFAGAHGYLKQHECDDIVYVGVFDAYCDNAAIFHGMTAVCKI